MIVSRTTAFTGGVPALLPRLPNHDDEEDEHERYELRCRKLQRPRYEIELRVVLACLDDSQHLAVARDCHSADIPSPPL